MKILILTHTFPRNSKDVAAAFMKELSDGLVACGNKVAVLAPYDVEFRRRGDPFKIITYKYIWPRSLHILGYSRTMEGDVKLRRRAFLLLPFMLLFGTLALYRAVKKERPDIISVHWILPNGLMALIVSRLTCVPYTVTLPGTDTYLAGKYKAFGLVARAVARGSSGLFSNSSWHLNKILNLGVKDVYSEVITYPVDINRFKPTKKRLTEIGTRHNLKDSDLVLLAVGRLVYKKGFNYLIEAIPGVVRKHPGVKLLIGGDGDLKQEWTELARQLKVDQNVIFVGTIRRDEILYYYNLADIVVTPSIIDQEGNVDGRPLVILESMACGKPQIVTKLPGISDSLCNGVNAILVPQKNAGAITKALLKLIGAPGLRHEMGRKNRDIAVKNLGIRSIGRKYTAAFKKTLASQN